MGAPPPNPRFGGNRKLTKRDNPFLKINRSLHFIRFSFLLNLTHATYRRVGVGLEGSRSPRISSRTEDTEETEDTGGKTCGCISVLACGRAGVDRNRAVMRVIDSTYPQNLRVPPFPPCPPWELPSPARFMGQDGIKRICWN